MGERGTFLLQVSFCKILLFLPLRSMAGVGQPQQGGRINRRYFSFFRYCFEPEESAWVPLSSVKGVFLIQAL